MTYVDELAAELGRLGVRGRLRRRILAEVDDHLRSDEEAESRFGSPNVVANGFAAELGTRASRHAAVIGFFALGVAGGVFAACLAGLSLAGRSAVEPPAAAVASLVLIIAPQVAFVSGTLALLRVVRRRNDGVFTSAERVMVNRRTSLALAAGLATMGALAALGIEYRHELAHWWASFTLIATLAASILLLLAAVSAIRAIRLHAQVPGPAGDMFDDVGFVRYRDQPWRFAARVALLVGLAVWVAGIAASDPIDGLLRGVFEALACLGGFAVLGRYLGLRA
jgi:hypothetical protein